MTDEDRWQFEAEQEERGREEMERQAEEFDRRRIEISDFASVQRWADAAGRSGR